jgi:hypothetical protein
MKIWRYLTVQGVYELLTERDARVARDREAERKEMRVNSEKSRPS